MPLFSCYPAIVTVYVFINVVFLLGLSQGLLETTSLLAICQDRGKVCVRLTLPIWDILGMLLLSDNLQVQFILKR